MADQRDEHATAVHEAVRKPGQAYDIFGSVGVLFICIFGCDERSDTTVTDTKRWWVVRWMRTTAYGATPRRTTRWSTEWPCYDGAREDNATVVPKNSDAGSALRGPWNSGGEGSAAAASGA